MDHRGTPSSPIVVVDSEDEVHGVLCATDDPEDLSSQAAKRKREPAFIPHESKKARKRRRRVERQVTETEVLPHQQHWLPLWTPSNWVSAMAIAGSLPDQFQWQPQFVPAPVPPPLPPPPPPPPPKPSSPPPALLERVSSPHRLPKKPPSSSNSIGMKPDTEPHSKHGVFHFNSTNLSNRRSNASYMPNPACTIVMEQLPKTHRTIEFVKQWAKKATGVLPLSIVVDPPSAKALVEFPSAKLARKAWESPRLGTEYGGLKSHQLKGKPRTDQIRVWWYRVDGVGAGAGVGEIEEGEIDDDTLDRKGQPESKKARKARLARERLEKVSQRVAMRASLPELVVAKDEVDSIASSREASVAPVEAQDPVPAPISYPIPTNLSDMKRTLLAKQKELEEKIAQSKLEMSKMTSALASAPAPAPPPPPPPVVEDNKAVEDRLRKLVLQSQKARASAAIPSSIPTPSTTGKSTPTSIQVHTSTVSSFSLEDLAVSFITETLSTLRQSGSAPAPRPQSMQQNPNTKEELAARQKRLEEYIADSKMLMTQLTQARTKQEKDRLLALMREKTRWVLLLPIMTTIFLLWEDLLRGGSRLMDEEKEKMEKASDEEDVMQRRPTPEEKPAFAVRWPTMSRDGGIMIISDDEEEDSE